MIKGPHIYNRAFEVLANEPWLTIRELADRIDVKYSTLTNTYWRNGVTHFDVQRDIMRGILRERNRLQKRLAA
tara:strand:+ start:135 stop:353 length:219 start_codon:yes stop_codon:yes gene_type:complete